MEYGTGYYDYGTYVSVSSSRPANSVFTNWTGDTQYLTGPVTQEYNSVKIPDVNTITITAHWTAAPTPPATNIKLTVVNGTIADTGKTEGLFTQGDRINIIANATPDGQVFDGWIKDGGGSIANDNSSNTIVTIGDTDATVTATYRTLEYHDLTVVTNSGTTTKTLEKYDYFSVDAEPAPDGQVFEKWTGDTNSFNQSFFHRKFYCK